MNRFPVSKLRNIAVLMAMWFSVSTLRTMASEYLFSTIALNEGLTQTTAKAMLRDSRGYLWIGTRSGLNRYDAGSMECFFNDPDNPASLPDNDIVDIFEDDGARVWVVCDKGTAIYDRIGGGFRRVENNGHPLRIRSHIKTGEGMLLGGGGQLFVYDYATDAVKPATTSGGSNRYYTEICHGEPGRYLLATRWDGLWEYDTESGKIRRYPFCSERNIMALAKDGRGNIWVSPYGDGLLCIDSHGRCIFRADAAKLGSGIVLDLLADEDIMWVATDGGGINIIDTRDFNVTKLPGGIENGGHSLRSVIRMYRDDNGYVYAGTVREGMTCIYRSPMRTFRSVPGAEGMTVTALSADGENIWIGLDGGGLVNYRAADHDRFAMISGTEGMKITSIEHFDPDRLLLSTFDHGLFVFDKRSSRLTPAPAPFDEVVEANAKKALPLDLRRLHDGTIAVLSDRIYICDPRRNRWDEVTATRVNNHLNEFYTDYRHMLCFTDGEIVRYDIAGRRVETLATLPERTISCAAYDGDRCIYIGTATGIKCLDTVSGDISQMENNAPLPARVTALLFDSGRMWIAAGGAVYIKNFNTGQFCKFDRYDGVTPNEFIYKSTLATPDRIFMGGVNGLLKIDRTEVPDFMAHKLSLPVRVTDVVADGLTLASADLDANLFDIPYDHSNVTLRVTGGEPHPLRQSPFRFFINSPDGDSPIETSDNTFTINRLAGGGRYDIYASAVAPDGSWSVPRRVAVLNVLRPWWKSPWAIASYIIIGIILVSAFFAYMIRRRRRAEAKIIEETHRQSLENEVGFLMNMNHELRTPLTLIYSRLRSLIEDMQTHKAADALVLDELGNIYQSTRRMRDIINTTVDQWASTAAPDKQAPELPRTAEPDSTVLQDSAPVDTSAMTVIIAEEDPELGNYIADNLAKIFGKVVVAPDGKDALAAVKNTSPDLIITDAHLPGMSGTELCRHIKRLDEYSHIPIVMLTTRLEDMSLRGGNDLGADIYITKPFDMHQLANRCRMVLRTFDRVKQRYKSSAADILPRETYNNEAESFLLKVKEIIEQNIALPGFGVDIIVDKMLMSRSSLYTKFKELTGQSLGTYIEEYRVGRAKEMLASTDMTMSEISDALGFSTQRYFSTFFKKKTGLSPSRFRQENHPSPFES